MITQELLQKFCAANDYREYIRRPWKVGERVYATNGKYAIRLDSADGHSVEEITGKRANVEKLIAEHVVVSEWGSVPNLPAKIDCWACRGTGKVRLGECEDCDGNGSFWHGNHDYECQNCDGTGWHAVDGGAEQDCSHCLGIGEELCRRENFTKVYNATVDGAFLRVIAQLPNVKVSSGKTATDPIMFEFDGGCGLLMPLRV